ncbi:MULTISPECIES: hypothetical protein [Rhodomicrobium]|uniref:hypothetical protein n=1 Tax=Rhodomicrobium TaxID=1068 RepID=UPI000B4AF639|nr:MULTISPECIES: hypothetical protein [Rhodomicrobium]
MAQDDVSRRSSLLKRDLLLVGIAASSLLNGIYLSPLFDPAFATLRQFAPGFFISAPLLLLYFTSLLLAAATLVVAGVPAALFERLTGRTHTDAASLGVWLAATALLAAPSLLAQLGVLD